MNAAVIAFVLFTGGTIASMIAYSRIPTTATAVVYFIFGAAFPLIGIVAALLTKPENQPTPAGWYPDPYETGSQRWFDGATWTEHFVRTQ